MRRTYTHAYVVGACSERSHARTHSYIRTPTLIQVTGSVIERAASKADFVTSHCVQDGEIRNIGSTVDIAMLGVDAMHIVEIALFNNDKSNIYIYIYIYI